MICLENSEVDIMRRDLLNGTRDNNDFVIKTSDDAEITLMNVEQHAQQQPSKFYEHPEENAYKYTLMYSCKHRAYADKDTDAKTADEYEDEACYIVNRFEKSLEIEPDKEYPKNYYLVKQDELTEWS
jgi:hypothetical protein